MITRNVAEQRQIWDVAEFHGFVDGSGHPVFLRSAFGYLCSMDLGDGCRVFHQKEERKENVWRQ